MQEMFAFTDIEADILVKGNVGFNATQSGRLSQILKPIFLFPPLCVALPHKEQAQVLVPQPQSLDNKSM